jgi:hypothetical protein
MDKDLATIVDALANYRGLNNFFTPGRSLRCDFYVPSQNLIIEYDERQHFTIPRDISLSLYPPNLELNFDMRIWRDACQTIRATDNDPIFRDEQRAFYDSLRDILSIRNGCTIARIKHGDHDWKVNKQFEQLEIMLSLQ